MATESIILELNAETDWGGVSATTLNRDDAIVTGQRYYKFNIVGLHGILPAGGGELLEINPGQRFYETAEETLGAPSTVPHSRGGTASSNLERACSRKVRFHGGRSRSCSGKPPVPSRTCITSA